MASNTTAGNVQANNSTGARNNRTGDGATTTDVDVLAARDGSAAEPAETTPTNVTPEKPKRVRNRKPAARKAATPKADAAPTASSGKFVRKQITAPSRLEKIRKSVDEGNPVSNVIIVRRAGTITAYEMVEDKG